MFVRSVAAAALERKKELFSVYERNRQEEQKRMKRWLQELKTESAASLNSQLDAHRQPLARRTAHGRVRPRSRNVHPPGRELAKP